MDTRQVAIGALAVVASPLVGFAYIGHKLDKRNSGEGVGNFFTGVCLGITINHAIALNMYAPNYSQMYQDPEQHEIVQYISQRERSFMGYVSPTLEVLLKDPLFFEVRVPYFKDKSKNQQYFPPKQDDYDAQRYPMA